MTPCVLLVCIWLAVFNLSSALNINEQYSWYWKRQSSNILSNKISQTNKLNTNKAKNVILYIGDGMGPSIVTAARIYRSQKHDMDYQTPFTFDRFPFVGMQKTYDLTSHVTDSASSATAYFSGVKVKRGTLGLVPGSEDDDKNCMLKGRQIQTIASWALSAGKSVGFVTRTRVTHATPAAMYAHTPDRDYECDKDIPKRSKGCKDIAAQLVMDFPGNQFKVMMGGGLKNFLPKDYKIFDRQTNRTKKGKRRDHRDLVKEWLNRGNNRTVVKTKAELDRLKARGYNVDSVLGLFDRSHMEFALLDQNPSTRAPTLAEMTNAAISILSHNPNGYLLLVEGGRIDHALHQNRAKLALEEVIQFDSAVAEGMKLTNPSNTLVVVTADHSHVMTITGYPPRSLNILDTYVPLDSYKKHKSTVLVFANGPSGIKKHLPDLDDADTEADLYQQPSLFRMSKETHGGEDVAVYANGPWSHLFTGVYENTFIPEAMACAASIGLHDGRCR